MIMSRAKIWGGGSAVAGRTKYANRYRRGVDPRARMAGKPRCFDQHRRHKCSVRRDTWNQRSFPQQRYPDLFRGGRDADD